jgi:hypothetical protein
MWWHTITHGKRSEGGGGGIEWVISKAGDTLSSRHVSSRDVTSAVGIFNIECVHQQKFKRRAGV